MDVEKEELVVSIDGTDELGIDRAGMLVFRSLSDMIDDDTRAGAVHFTVCVS